MMKAHLAFLNKIFQITNFLFLLPLAFTLSFYYLLLVTRMKPQKGKEDGDLLLNQVADLKLFIVEIDHKANKSV